MEFRKTVMITLYAKQKKRHRCTEQTFGLWGEHEESVVLNKYLSRGASQGVLVVKNLPTNVQDLRDAGLIPGLGRSPGEGNGNPLQDSCLENPMDRRAWRAMVQKAAKSQT